MEHAVPKAAHIWARHPQDWYVEPHWCSARLFEAEAFSGAILDPSCGTGRIVEAAHRAGYVATGADLVRRSPVCVAEEDFLASSEPADNIVTNPPFAVADQYARHALMLARHKVALLLPTKWMNAASRSAWLETTPLATVWLLAPRPSMPPGTVIEAGAKAGSGTVDFAWFVWDHARQPGHPVIRWLRRDHRGEMP
jgi:hypothetical protein